MKQRLIKDITRVVELQYDRQYTAPNKESLDEVTAWVGQEIKPSFVGYNGDFTYFALDRHQKQIVRVNSQLRTIGLSQQVIPKVDRLIRHILKTEIRGLDN